MTTVLKRLRLLVQGRSGIGGKNRKTHAPQQPKKLALWNGAGSPKKSFWDGTYPKTRLRRPAHSE